MRAYIKLCLSLRKFCISFFPNSGTPHSIYHTYLNLVYLTPLPKYSAFNEGGNMTTGYGAVNISRTLQLSLPIAE
jgi:hypothetical protein